MKAALFTIVLEYRGGTYIGQVRATSVGSAATKWARSNAWDAMPSMRRPGRSSPADAFVAEVADEPLAVEQTENLWCVTGLVRGHLALVHVVKTQPGDFETQITVSRAEYGNIRTNRRTAASR